MSEYRKNAVRTLTAAQVQEFRKKANALCDAEKNYKGKRFGDTLEVIEAYDAPIYMAMLKAQHDRRTLYFSEPVPTSAYHRPTVVNFSQVDVTGMAPYPTRFTNMETKIEVPGSSETITCKHCGGEGTVTCSHCHGKGKVTVEERCSSCYGHGYTTVTKREVRYVRDSDGRTVQEVTQVPKSVTCTRCGGSGKIAHEEPCPTCHGSRRESCPACNGSGRLERHMVMRHEQYVDISKRYITPDILSTNDKRELERILDKLSGGWNVRDSYDIQGTAFGSCEGLALPVVGGIVRDVTAHQGSSKDNRLCFSTLYVVECSSTAIRYRFEGKEYTAVIYGGTDTLFVATSPISDYFNELRDSIEESAKKTNYGQSWKKLKQLVESSQATNEDRHTLHMLEQRLEETAMLGHFTGLVIAMVLLFPPLNCYLACFNIVAPWTDLIYHYVYPAWVDSTVRALVGLGLSFWIIKDGMLLSKFTWQHESGATRFWLGLANGLGAMLLCTLLVCIANYLGLIQLFIAFIILVLGLISFLISIVITIVMAVTTHIF